MIRPRFDIDKLRELAGDKVFARGEAYLRNDQVTVLSVESEAVLAQVAGTEDYRTKLTGRGSRIGGECSCPAFDDWGFCKHMVAAALAVNGLDGGGADGAMARIRAHLKKKGVDGLTEMIIELAERDPALFRKLDLAAAAVDADDETIEARLRKAIDDTTRTRGYVDYRSAPEWAANVDAVLASLADIGSGRLARVALDLAERAIERIEEATEEIDDSDGHCGALLDRAREIHLAAARETKPEPVRLARNLFAREMKEGYGTFSGAAETYEDVLGEEGLAEYRSLAAKAWDELPPRTAGRAAREPNGRYEQLWRILDFFAERDGDLDARIALRAKDLSSPWRYLQLAEFCRAHGQEDLALRRAEEGLWMFEDDRPDERLVFFAADLLAAAGRKSDAEAQLRRAFEKAPSLALYARLRALGGTEAGERAVEFLESRLVTEQRTAWYEPADLLIRILADEKKFDAAWAAVRRHGASMGVRETLARASEAGHPAEAVEVYARRVHQLAEQGGNPAYAEAAELVARMAGLRGAAEQAAYVAMLKERFGRKRNFMKLLG